MFQSGLQEIIHALYAPDPHLSAQAKQELIRLGRWDIIKQHHMQTYRPKKIKLILNKTKQIRKRITLISGNMDGHQGYPSMYYHLVDGCDRGYGYQGAKSIGYFLTDLWDMYPESIEKNMRSFLAKEGFDWYLKEIDENTTF